MTHHAVEYNCERLPLAHGFLHASKDATTDYLKGIHHELRDIDEAAFSYELHLRSPDASVATQQILRVSGDTWFEFVDPLRIVQVKVFWPTEAMCSILAEERIQARLRALVTVDLFVWIPEYFRDHLPCPVFSLVLPVTTRDCNPYTAFRQLVPDLPDFVLVHDLGQVPNCNMGKVAKRLKWLPHKSFCVELHGGARPDR